LVGYGIRRSRSSRSSNRLCMDCTGPTPCSRTSWSRLPPERTPRDRRWTDRRNDAGVRRAALARSL